ncbi:MAG: hypothetical protein RSC09_04950 [Clostridia bacterium]
MKKILLQIIICLCIMATGMQALNIQLDKNSKADKQIKIINNEIYILEKNKDPKYNICKERADVLISLLELEKENKKCSFSKEAINEISDIRFSKLIIRLRKLGFKEEDIDLYVKPYIINTTYASKELDLELLNSYEGTYLDIIQSGTYNELIEARRAVLVNMQDYIANINLKYKKEYIDTGDFAYILKAEENSKIIDEIIKQSKITPKYNYVGNNINEYKKHIVINSIISCVGIFIYLAFKEKIQPMRKVKNKRKRNLAKKNTARKHILTPSIFTALVLIDQIIIMLAIII